MKKSELRELNPTELNENFMNVWKVYKTTGFN